MKPKPDGVLERVLNPQEEQANNQHTFRVDCAADLVRHFEQKKLFDNTIFHLRHLLRIGKLSSALSSRAGCNIAIMRE